MARGGWTHTTFTPLSKKHTKAKALSEMQILMQVYQDTELYSFQAGRTFNVDFMDDFELG